MPSSIAYSRGLSSRLNSPPSTPRGQGNIYGTSPSFVSSASSDIGCVSEKLDQVLAAFSNQSQLLADICVGHRSATVYSTNFRQEESVDMCMCILCGVCTCVVCACFHSFPFSLYLVLNITIIRHVCTHILLQKLFSVTMRVGDAGSMVISLEDFTLHKK